MFRSLAKDEDDDGSLFGMISVAEDDPTSMLSSDPPALPPGSLGVVGDFPTEVFGHIFSFLPFYSLCFHVRHSCRTFRNIVDNYEGLFHALVDRRLLEVPSTTMTTLTEKSSWKDRWQDLSSRYGCETFSSIQRMNLREFLLTAVCDLRKCFAIRDENIPDATGQVLFDPRFYDEVAVKKDSLGFQVRFFQRLCIEYINPNAVHEVTAIYSSKAVPPTFAMTAQGFVRPRQNPKEELQPSAIARNLTSGSPTCYLDEEKLLFRRRLLRATLEGDSTTSEFVYKYTETETTYKAETSFSNDHGVFTHDTFHLDKRTGARLFLDDPCDVRRTVDLVRLRPPSPIREYPYGWGPDGPLRDVWGIADQVEELSLDDLDDGGQLMTAIALPPIDVVNEQEPVIPQSLTLHPLLGGWRNEEEQLENPSREEAPLHWVNHYPTKSDDWGGKLIQELMAED